MSSRGIPAEQSSRVQMSAGQTAERLPLRDLRPKPPIQTRDAEPATRGIHSIRDRTDRRSFRIRRLLAFGDSIAIVGAIGLSVALGQLTGLVSAPVSAVMLAPIGVALWLIIGAMLGAFHVDERRIDCAAADEVGRVAQATAVWTWALFLVEDIRLEGPQQAVPVVVIGVLLVPIVLVVRHVTRRVARRYDWYKQSALIVGTAADTSRLRTLLMRHPEYGVTVTGTVKVPPGRGEEDRVLALLDTVAQTAPDRVVFASQYEGLDERTGALRYLAERGVKVDLIPGDSEVFRSDAEVHFAEGVPFLTLPTTIRPRSSAFVKRVIDIVVAGSGLLLLSPLFLYCAFRIKLDSPGPILFHQRRTGLKGEVFEVVKFRTMSADAEGRLGEVFEFDPGDHHVMFKLERDPRVTKFGAKLRRLSLDELPQLINVLRGEMSLVGPRPLPVHESDQVPDRYRARFRVRPGVTGPWQVLGRSAIPFDDMLKLDYTYVTNWSIGDDVKLLVRTLGAITHGRGAY